MQKDNEFEPIDSMPSFKDVFKDEHKHRSKPQKKTSWSYRFWEKQKSKPQRGRKTQEGEKQVKVQRQPVSLSKPVLMALLTFLIMILGLLAPATLALCRSVTYLSETAENTLRRLGNGNTKQDNT
jgi:hypothetical protein